MRLFAAAEPARDAALGLGSTVLDRLVKLIDGLDGLCLGVLDVSLGLALEFVSLLVGFGPLNYSRQ